MRRMYYGGGHFGGGQYAFGPGPLSPAVKMLLWVNIGIFLLTWPIPPLFRLVTALFGLTPDLVLGRLWLWQPVSYMFLHGGVTHVLFNMLILWMFGIQLERVWGSRFFLRYYFITGIGAGIATILAAQLPFAFAEPTATAVTIGASGAIFGLLIAFALYYPDTPIYMFLLFPVPAKYFVMIVGAVAFLSIPNSPGIAHIAHLGGLVVGYVYLRRWGGAGRRAGGLGRLGIVADIKYRYFKWKMGRLKKRFGVYEGRGGNWNDRVH